MLEVSTVTTSKINKIKKLLPMEEELAILLMINTLIKMHISNMLKTPTIPTIKVVHLPRLNISTHINSNILTSVQPLFKTT